MNTIKSITKMATVTAPRCLALLASIAAICLISVGIVLATANAASAQEAKDPCATQQCVLAPRAEIEALILRAYKAGKEEGLQDCRVRSGSFTSLSGN